jgi:prevent-host-death family protein
MEGLVRHVNVHAAKTHFSKLIDAAAAGEEIIIAKAGKPVAKLVPLTDPAPRPRSRPHRCRVTMATRSTGFWCNRRWTNPRASIPTMRALPAIRNSSR